MIKQIIEKKNNEYVIEIVIHFELHIKIIHYFLRIFICKAVEQIALKVLCN